MPAAIPDLWHTNEDAARLYMLYLARLQMNRLYQRVVFACRQIRRHAARDPGLEEAMFTFSFEIDALCDLKDYKTAWRQMRRWEKIIFGERLDLDRRQWSPSDEWAMEHYYAPLLYFRGRYCQGCWLLETYLRMWFDTGKVRSYDILFRVYNGDEEPSHRCRVTLAHFYNRLGRSLLEWEHWESFVNGFHPRLFRVAGVPHGELLVDSDRLAPFFDKLMEVRAERTISGVGGGQSILTDSPGKVRKRQEALQQRLAEFEERTHSVHERRQRQLEELFPELRGLPK